MYLESLNLSGVTTLGGEKLAQNLCNNGLKSLDESEVSSA